MKQTYTFVVLFWGEGYISMLKPFKWFFALLPFKFWESDCYNLVLIFSIKINSHVQLHGSVIKPLVNRGPLFIILPSQ